MNSNVVVPIPVIPVPAVLPAGVERSEDLPGPSQMHWAKLMIDELEMDIRKRGEKLRKEAEDLKRNATTWEEWRKTDDDRWRPTRAEKKEWEKEKKLVAELVPSPPPSPGARLAWEEEWVENPKPPLERLGEPPMAQGPAADHWHRRYQLRCDPHGKRTRTPSPPPPPPLVFPALPTPLATQATMAENLHTSHAFAPPSSDVFGSSLRKNASALLQASVDLVRFRRHQCGPVRGMQNQFARLWQRMRGFRRWHKNDLTWFYPLIYCINELLYVFDTTYFRVPPPKGAASASAAALRKEEGKE